VERGTSGREVVREVERRREVLIKELIFVDIIKLIVEERRW
jgi:hypothetical protein